MTHLEDGAPTSTHSSQQPGGRTPQVTHGSEGSLVHLSAADLTDALRIASLSVVPVLAGLAAVVGVLSAIVLPDGHEGSLADWLRMAILVTVLAVGGRAVMDGSLGVGDALAQAGVGVRVIPLVITLLLLGLTARASVRAERRRPSGSRSELVVRALLAGLATGGGLAVLSLVATTSDFFGLDLAAEVDWAAGRVTIGAGALGAFVGGSLLTGTAATLARFRAAVRPAEPRPAPLPAGFGMVLRTLWTFALGLAGVAAVAVLIFFLYELLLTDDLIDAGVPTIAGLLVLALNAVVAVVLGVAGTPVGVTAHSSSGSSPLSSLGGVDPSGNSWSFSLFDQPWALSVLLIPAVIALGTAVRRTLRQPYVPVTSQAVKLGAACGAVAALGLALLVRMSFSGGVAGTASADVGDTGFADVDLGFSLLWAPLLGGLWAALVMWTMGVGATLALSLPRRAVRLIGGRRTTPEWDAVLAGLVPAPAGRRATSVRAAALTTGGLVGLGVVGAIGVAILNATVFGPKGAVEAYLDDVAAGDFAAVREHLATDPDATREPLLSDVVMDSGDFTAIRSPRVTGVQENDSVVAASVAYSVGDRRVEDTVHLVPGERRWGLFRTWQVTDSLPTVEVDTAEVAVLVADQRLVGDTFVALPGQYTFHAEEHPLLVSQQESLAVSNDGVNVLRMSPEVKAEALLSARAAVDGRLRACAQSTQLPVPNCPFSPDSFSQDTWTNVRISITEMPVYSLAYRQASGRLEIVTSNEGRYEIAGTKTVQSYVFDEPYSYETEDSASFSVEGNVSFVDGKPIAYLD